MFDILIQLSNLFLGTALFESGREWGFILVIAAAYFEGGKLKIHATASRNWLLNGSSGKKIRYLESVEKFYQCASKYTLMILLGSFSGCITVSGGLNPASSPASPLLTPQP